MKLREKIAKERPDLIADGTCDGGVQGCPFIHGYESKEERELNAPCHGITSRHNNELCTACWDREYVSQDGVSKSERATELRNKIIDTCRRLNCPAWLESEIKELLGLFEEAVANEAKKAVMKGLTEKWEDKD